MQLTKSNIDGIDIPSAKATRFKCRTTNSNGMFVDIVVEQVGIKFFHVYPTGETREIGDYYEYLKEMRQRNAMWLTRKGQNAKLKTKRIFLTRDEAKRLLRNGRSMVSLDMNTTITPMEDYTGCICSNGETTKIEDIPSGEYCVDWRVEPLKETFAEYKARMHRMQKEAHDAAMKSEHEAIEERERETKKEREREEANERKLKEAKDREEKLKAKIEKLRDELEGRRPMAEEAPATSTQPKKKSSYKDFFKGVAVGAGVVLAAFCGVKVYKKKAA